MKKIVFLFLFFLMLINPMLVSASTKEVVKLSKCVDGDTANFIYNDETIKVRFLAIDTRETVHPTKEIEKYGKEASNFTCNTLSNANKIELEFDENSDTKDKYGRYLAWIWVDDKLLQEELINNGLAEVAYLYSDYKYTNILKNQQKIAQNKKIGIWDEKKDDNTNNENYYFLIVIGVLILIIGSIISKKFRKKTIKKIKKNINKNFKKVLK